MKDKQQSYFVNIGSSSLLVIFLVLCLATFAILTLSSARSDHSFSERLAEHKKIYYEASAKAETVAAGIDEILYQIAEKIDPNSQSGAYGEYLENVEETLDGQQIEGVLLATRQTEAGCTVSFRVPAGARQELSVMLQVTDYREHVHYYEVKIWEIVNRDSQEAEQPLNLMPVIE